MTVESDSRALTASRGICRALPQHSLPHSVLPLAAGLAQVLPGRLHAFAIRAAVLMAWPGIYHLADFARGRLLRRNPGPPPFSSMNSAPSDSALRTGSLLGFGMLEGLLKRHANEALIRNPLFFGSAAHGI